MTIPKIIHQIHLGSNPLSIQQLEWQKTWKIYNPDWQHILWNDKSISTLTIQNTTQLNNCKNFAEKSDILRLEILYQFGGLYIDTDFECLKNINPLIEKYSSKNLIIFLETKKQIGSAFIISDKNNKLLKKLLDYIPAREISHKNHSTNLKYGPKYITDILGLNIAIEDGFNSKIKTVYPYIWTEKHRSKENFKETHPEAYAAHHWFHSWSKPYVPTSDLTDPFDMVFLDKTKGE